MIGLGFLAAVTPLYAADIDEIFYQEALAAVASGERERALEMLETLIRRRPGHAGAWLDLALLYCDLGDTAKSREILTRIETEFDPSPVIRDLIGLQRNRACKTAAAELSWSLGFQAGHDSNVNRGASNNRVVMESGAGPVVAQLADDALARHDNFGEGWAEAYWRRESRSLRVSALSRRHANIAAYNAQSLSITGEQAWSGVPAEGSLRLQWASTWLGGPAFLDTLTASAGVTGRGSLHGIHPVADLALARHHFPAAPAFDAYIWSLRPGLAKSVPAYAWRANLIAAADMADDTRPGGDRYGIGVEVLGAWRLAPGVQLSGSGLVQQIRSTEPYFPPLLNAYRHQTLWLGRLELAVDIGRGIHWLTAWTGQKSEDNLSFLGYRTNVLQSGLMVKY